MKKKMKRAEKRAQCDGNEREWVPWGGDGEEDEGLVRALVRCGVGVVLKTKDPKKIYIKTKTKHPVEYVVFNILSHIMSPEFEYVKDNRLSNENIKVKHMRIFHLNLLSIK